MNRKLAYLGTLYFVQGLPFGFQTKTLQYHLTEHGASLTAISLAGALSLPWLLKPLWAPLVDRFGTRRQWILPLQGLLIAVLLAAAALPPSALVPLLALVFVMNLITATQDIAVDGLAVDLLRESELGGGNAAQVVGYKLGMLMSGSVLVLVTPTWAWLFLAMAGMVLGGVLITAMADDPARAPGAAGMSLRAIGDLVVRSARAPGGLVLIGWVVSYKLGESVSDAMWKPFLQRGLGYSKETLATWDLEFGTPFSIAGSLLGGVVATRLGATRAVALLAGLRLLPAVMELVCSLGSLEPGPGANAAVISVTCAEELTGGALTTAMFAFMMSRVDHRIGATHYTVLAALEVLGKTPGSLMAGFVADRFGGFPAVFAVALALSVLALVGLGAAGGIKSLQPDLLSPRLPP